MAQHFRLSPLSRNFTTDDVDAMSDQDVVDFFTMLRWGSNVQQVCPYCAVIDTHYLRRVRKRTCRRPASRPGSNLNPIWQCKHCQTNFQVTTLTIFHATKLPLRKILKAIIRALAHGNGLSAISMQHELCVSYKTAFLFQHRLREAMAADLPTQPFDGAVQMDGGYFCGKPRKANERRSKPSREQLARRYNKQPIPADMQPWEAMGLTKRNYNKLPNKRTVIVVVKSGAHGKGGVAAVVGVCRKGENQENVSLMADAYIAPGSIVMTDESTAYNHLQVRFEHYSVSHAKEFCTSEGVHDNHAEAFFSRMRRAELGIFHGYRPVNLHYYASEAAWRHTYRLLPKDEMVKRLLRGCLLLGPSTRLCGYYQRKGHRPEILIDSPS